MKEKIAKLSASLLNEEYELYDILNNKTEWWKKIINDKDVYVEIRKNNVVEIYFNGGRMAKITINNHQLSVTAHPKYLEYTDINNSKYYRKRIENGKEVYNAIYQDCKEWFLDNSKYDKLKENIKKYYSGGKNGEDTKEKYIQGYLITENKNIYFDSEFQHRLFEGQRKSIRIDLVKIVDNNFVFVELKTINDNRLNNDEIVKQMKNYKNFVIENKDELSEYYHTLYKIKKKLGITVPPVFNIDSVSVNTTPELLIINDYDKLSKQRKERLQKIKKTLEDERINFVIDNRCFKIG